MSRLLFRHLIVFLFIAFTAYCGDAVASPEEAQQFVEKVSKSALDVITSNANTAQKEKKLSDLFLTSVDTKWIAKFAIGKYWNDATEAQRAKYMEMHKKFLLSGYVPKFREYNNQQIKILKSSAAEDGEYLVETRIISADGADVSVSYKVRKSDGGKYMVFDVIAEGVSLITTERADFASILSRDGIDALIEKLGQKS